MPLDPTSPFFEGDLREFIKRELGVLPAIVRSLNNNNLAHGSVSCTFTASTNAPAQTVTHGLGRTPRAVVFGPTRSSGEVRIAASLDSAPGATTFDVVAWAGASITGTVTVYWIAV